MRTPLLTAIGVLLVLFGGTAFLFRHQTQDSTELGDITHVYRWGRPAFVVVDANSDGVIDMRVRVPGTFATGAPPLEWWEVPCNERGFKYHVILKDGEVVAVETDEECRGSYTARYAGDDAKRFYDERVRPLPPSSRTSRRQP
jgi:hypothetical protein